MGGSCRTKAGPISGPARGPEKLEGAARHPVVGRRLARLPLDRVGHYNYSGINTSTAIQRMIYVKQKDTLGLHLYTDDNFARIAGFAQRDPASPGVFKEPTKRLAVSGLTKIKRRRKLKAFSAPILPFYDREHLFPSNLVCEIKLAGQQVSRG